jgi:GH25 family lysozyme M1 (1,4-beta-N-acetylmuramidase)
VSEGRPTYRTGKVVDISSHNVVTDWKKLKQSCDAVIIRIGYRGYESGTLVQDTSYASNVYNCKQYGIPYSVYFFTTAVSDSEGVEEGNWIADRLGGQTLCFPVFIDSEYSNSSHTGRSDSLSSGTRTAAVKGACSQLNARGVSSGVYGSTYWLNNNLNMSDLPYYVWVAHYSDSCGYGGSKLLWQFTSNASGYGVRTGSADRCDVSYWYQ